MVKPTETKLMADMFLIYGVNVIEYINLEFGVTTNYNILYEINKKGNLFDHDAHRRIKPLHNLPFDECLRNYIIEKTKKQDLTRADLDCLFEIKSKVPKRALEELGIIGSLDKRLYYARAITRSRSTNFIIVSEKTNIEGLLE